MQNRRAAKFLGELAGCGDAERKAQVLLRKFERVATPDDVSYVLRGLDDVPEIAANAVRQSVIAGIADEIPELYIASKFANSVDFFSDRVSPSADKTALICFTGSARRMMLPAATFLQALPASRFDVVMLKDEQRLHYQAGVEGYAETLAELVQRLAKDLDTGSYRRVVTMGTSMGGFPALRAGILMQADRALSLGGREMWHVGRLGRLDDYPSCVAFDALCPCAPPSPELACVFTSSFHADRRSAEIAAALRPVTFVESNLGTGHDVLFVRWKRGQLRHFLDYLISGDLAEAAIAPTHTIAAAL